MFVRSVRFDGEVLVLVGIQHAFDGDAGCGGGFTRDCQ